MKPTHRITRWPLGWTLDSISGDSGIPITALDEALPIMPEKGHTDAGIAHHLKQTVSPETVMCIVSPKDGAKWRKMITESLEREAPEDRWWLGLDVGLSSASIFATLATFRDRRRRAEELAKGAAPYDSDDLGRCFRLLDLFPEWKGRLHEVAGNYPDGKWPAIIARWKQLEASAPATQTAILHHIHS